MNNVKIELNLVAHLLFFLYQSELVSQSLLLSPYSPSLPLSSPSSESTCLCVYKTSAVAGTAFRTGQYFPLMYS